MAAYNNSLRLAILLLTSLTRPCGYVDILFVVMSYADWYTFLILYLYYRYQNSTIYSKTGVESGNFNFRWLKVTRMRMQTKIKNQHINSIIFITVLMLYTLCLFPFNIYVESFINIKCGYYSIQYSHSRS